MCSHVPNKGEQMVRYYGYYSNVSRGRRKKADQDGLVLCILQPEESSKEYRKNWARLIQKSTSRPPARCHGPMRVISFIEDPQVIKRSSTPRWRSNPGPLRMPAQPITEPISIIQPPW
jgi:hypothetical protein